MAQSKLERRRALFRKFSANLALYAPEYDGRFACPICLRLFGPESVEPDTLYVDLAHVYPRALAKSPDVLTCRACNNTLGSNADSKIVTESRHDQALDGSGRQTIDVSVKNSAGDEIRAELRRQGSHWHFQEIPKQTNPRKREALLASLEASPQVLEFSGFHRDPAGVQVGLLHSAFLALFHRFGYEYRYRADCDVAHALLNGEALPLEHGVHVLPVPEPVEPALALYEPMATVVGSAVLCIGVALPPSHQGIACRIVLLPGFGYEGGRDYLDLHRLLRDAVTLDLGVMQVPRKLDHPESRFFGSRIWHQRRDRLYRRTQTPR